jgi:hypothetical protein
MAHLHTSADLEHCINLCTECHAVCEQTIRRCLDQGGRHATADHITLLRDCAQICETSRDYMLRDSPLHAETCAVCADVCERCAKECETYSEDFMQRCAEVCRRCAESCRQMAGKTRIAHAA